MSPRFPGLRRRSVQLIVAGAAVASVSVAGVAVAGASAGPAAAPAAPAPAAVALVAPAAGPQPVRGVALAPGDEMTVQRAPAAGGGASTQLMPPEGSFQYDVYFKISRTARYPQTVFSEVTNEGRFNQIFPIKGAKANLGRVGTKHNLTVARVPFPVTVAALGKTSWRFTTRKYHPDYPGTVQFWLYKKSDMLKLHVRGICAACGNGAYLAVAYLQWRAFARNIDKKVDL